jgi:hypothetical protein
MASNKSKSSSSSISSSFDAFAKVDAIVAKKVIGSDGAASWQSFRDDNPTTKDRFYSSNAPKAPLKKADKLGTGFSTWDEERDHEKKVRKDAGHATTGAGYTNFTKKQSSSNKDKQAIIDRIRPDDIQYFIPSKTFQGWKFDYIFTTRNSVHNTGYFWDGMDSIKKQNGEVIIGEDLKLANNQANNNNNNDNDKDTKRKKVKSSSSSSNNKKEKKKKKRKKNNNDNGPVIVHNPNNPMEQMQAILERRNRQLTGMLPTTTTTTTDDNNSVLPSGWEAAKDPSTDKTYYFHRATGDRSWEIPKMPPDSKDHDGGDGENNANEASQLPMGWKSVVDKASGKIYYHHTNGEVTWTKPG